MTFQEDLQDLLHTLRSEKNDENTLLTRSIVTTALVVLFTVLCLILHLSLTPHRVLSVLYLALSVFLASQTLSDISDRFPQIRLAPLTYLPAVLWFFSFSYFDIFYLGFGPRISFKSVVSSLFFLFLLILTYAVLTSILLDGVLSFYHSEPGKAFIIACAVSLVTIIIVWYFSMRIFHKAELSIRLTVEICEESYGVFARFWDYLGYL